MPNDAFSGSVVLTNYTGVTVPLSAYARQHELRIPDTVESVVNKTGAFPSNE